MADYKGIKGFTVQNLSADPPTPIEGQVWYNSTSGTMKGYAPATGAWSSGNDLNTAREQPGGAGVSKSSAICIGGLKPPSSSPRYQDITEIYNGTSWSEDADLNQERSLIQAAGTVTAALAFGGGNPAPPFLKLSETWDGTSWTATNPLTTGRVNAAGYGTTTAANTVGGETYIDNYEQYDGTCWSEAADLNQFRQYLRGCGTTTAGLVFGGRDNPATPTVSTAKTESWNGTSWSEVNDLITGRVNASGAGTQTAALMAGGASAPPLFQAITEQYDGTSWTEVGDMALGRVYLGSASSSPNSSSVVFAGYTPAEPAGISAATEEWTAGVQVRTFTSS